MRTLRKTKPEPSCLKSYRETPGADWSSVHGESRAELRKQLWRDQQGLCAYCQSRIGPSTGPDTDTDTDTDEAFAKLAESTMTIEHFAARSVDASKTFVWENLLGSCKGTSNGDDHCDKYRGAKPLPLHPCIVVKLESHFRYTKTGEIKVTETLSEAQRRDAQAMIANLHLNARTLMRNRAEVQESLGRQLARGADPRKLLALAATPRSGALEAFVQVALDYLTKKCAQRP